MKYYDNPFFRCYHDTPFFSHDINIGMKTIKIHASPRQLARLRNGHQVSVKPSSEGCGFNLIVDPGRWSILSKTFDKGRGARVRLTPDEISANLSVEGTGLYVGGRGIGAGMGAGMGAGIGVGIGAGIGAGIRSKSKAISKAIFAEPSERSELQVTNAGGPMARLTPRTISGVFDQSKLFSQMNQQLGTNMGNLQKATMGNAGADLLQGAHDIETIDTRKDDQVMGTGLYGVRRREGGSVGMNGGFVHGTPPALMSQPYGANFQFGKTLPVAYQRFSGSGLYP